MSSAGWAIQFLRFTVGLILLIPFAIIFLCLVYVFLCFSLAGGVLRRLWGIKK